MVIETVIVTLTATATLAVLWLTFVFIAAVGLREFFSMLGILVGWALLIAALLFLYFDIS